MKSATPSSSLLSPSFFTIDQMLCPSLLSPVENCKCPFPILECRLIKRRLYFLTIFSNAKHTYIGRLPVALSGKFEPKRGMRKYIRMHLCLWLDRRLIGKGSSNKDVELFGE